MDTRWTQGLFVGLPTAVAHGNNDMSRFVDGGMDMCDSVCSRLEEVRSSPASSKALEEPTIADWMN